MKLLLPSILLFSLGLSALIASAQTFDGTFVAVKGDVKILRSPTPNDPGPFAQLEGVKYSYEDAKVGKKINAGEIVQSGTDGKAKVAYPNGDTFLVGSGTSLVMPSIADKSSDKASTVKLIYGRMRSLISPKGPRNNMKVSTPDAVAGVRGTDFFVRANPDVGTQLTVLRGEVSVQNVGSSDEPTLVKTAYMTQVDHNPKTPPKSIEATKEELKALKIESAVRNSPDELAAMSPEQRKAVKDLSTEARRAVVDDVKERDPGLMKEIQKHKKMTDDDINDQVIARLYKNAPSAVKKKPTKEEVDQMGKGVYDKYYKNGQ